jgi:hypothetical protein
LFQARLIPPDKVNTSKQRKDEAHIVKFDFGILIETTSPDVVENIRKNKAYKEIEQAIKNISTYTRIVNATNIKHPRPVNHNKQGVFLFNYFFANNLQQNLRQSLRASPAFVATWNNNYLLVIDTLVTSKSRSE